MSVSVKDALDRGRSDRESTKLMRGSDLSNKQQTIIIRVIDVRESPMGFKSPIILDHHPVLEGCEAFPLNITNLEILGEKVGDDLSVLIGRAIVLRKYLTRNPQTKQTAYGLLVEAVEGVDVDHTGKPIKAAGKGKAKPVLKRKPESGKTLKSGRNKSRKVAPRKRASKGDEVPF